MNQCEATYPYQNEEKRCQLPEGHSPDSHQYETKDKGGGKLLLVWSDR
jgi:hypothetical protein